MLFYCHKCLLSIWSSTCFKEHKIDVSIGNCNLQITSKRAFAALLTWVLSFCPVSLSHWTTNTRALLLTMWYSAVMENIWKRTQEYTTALYALHVIFITLPFISLYWLIHLKSGFGSAFKFLWFNWIRWVWRKANTHNYHAFIKTMFDRCYFYNETFDLGERRWNRSKMKNDEHYASFVYDCAFHKSYRVCVCVCWVHRLACAHVHIEAIQLRLCRHCN